MLETIKQAESDFLEAKLTGSAYSGEDMMIYEQPIDLTNKAWTSAASDIVAEVIDANFGHLISKNKETRDSLVPVLSGMVYVFQNKYLTKTDNKSMLYQFLLQTGCSYKSSVLVESMGAINTKKTRRESGSSIGSSSRRRVVPRVVLPEIKNEVILQQLEPPNLILRHQKFRFPVQS